MKTYGQLLAWHKARGPERCRREEFIPADDFAELLEFATAQGHMAPRPGRPLLVLGTYWYEEVHVPIRPQPTRPDPGLSEAWLCGKSDERHPSEAEIADLVRKTTERENARIRSADLTREHRWYQR